jgi:hypothetical protein
MSKKLSKPQMKFLATLLAVDFAEGVRCPFLGNREAGRVASAWYRTAESLERRGLVRLERSGDSKRAFLTPAGAAELV